MGKDDKIFESISAIVEKSLINAPDKELGYFVSSKDAAYRNETIRKMLSGLNRDNQDRAMKFMFEMLLEQNQPRLRMEVA